MSASPLRTIWSACAASVIMPTAAVAIPPLCGCAPQTAPDIPAPGNRRARHIAARRHIHQVNAMLPQHAAPARRTRHVPAAFGPVRRGNPHEQRQVLRPFGAHRVHHLQQQPDAILKAAAVLRPCAGSTVATETRAAGSRAPHESPPRRTPPCQRPPRSRANASSPRRNLRRVQLLRLRIIRRERNRAGRRTSLHPPSAGVSSRSPSHRAVMLALRPACASWIPARAPCACTNSHNPLQHRDVLVLPDAEVVG